jgi:hypothetical protein
MKAYTTPEMCFQLGSARSVQTVHGVNEGKHRTRARCQTAPCRYQGPRSQPLECRSAGCRDCF